MNSSFQKVHYDKPSRVYWLKELCFSVITLRFFVGLGRLIGYYTVNCVISRQHAHIRQLLCGNLNELLSESIVR